MTSTDRLAAATQARRARYVQKRFAAQMLGRARGNSPQVHRHSQYAGDTETRAWARHNTFGATERRARVAAVQTWNYKNKRKGACWGPMGPSGERFLDSLMGLRCFRTGRLDMSIRSIARTLHMCVQTVVSYVDRLVDLGLLVKLRRSRPIENPDPGGPRVEQITNAYWFVLPPEIAEMVRQLLGRGGKPVDQEQHEREQAEKVQAMIDGMPAEEQARFYAGDVGPLAAALQAFGRARDRRAEGDSNPSNVTRSTR